jgi:endonuclease/exonuclease/phosphatase (EEP) superfamily protein YafD
MRRITAVVLVLAGLAVAAGLLDGVVWPGPPLALFRPQLTVILLGASLAALALGPRSLAVAGLAVAAVGAALLVPALRDPAPEPPAAGGPSLRLLTLNLWHRNDDASAVGALLEREQPDVVALVELTPAWQRALAPALRPYRVRAVEPREGSAGIGVYGSSTLRDARIVRLLGTGRPAVAARLDVAGRSLPLLVVHPVGALLPGDAGAHERQLAAIGGWARANGPRSVVCGDLNAAPWTSALRDALSEGRLRAALPGGLVAGSWPALPPPFRVAIDGCLVGRDVHVRTRLGPRVGSDHLPVVVDLR